MYIYIYIYVYIYLSVCLSIYLFLLMFLKSICMLSIYSCDTTPPPPPPPPPPPHPLCPLGSLPSFMTTLFYSPDFRRSWSYQLLPMLHELGPTCDPKQWKKLIQLPFSDVKKVCTTNFPKRPRLLSAKVLKVPPNCGKPCITNYLFYT